jgi:hypothetical protein
VVFGPLIKFPNLETQSLLEKSAIEGESPVEATKKETSGIQSTAPWIRSGNTGDINIQP